MASIKEYRQERLKKLQALQDMGIDPYTQVTNRTHKVNDVLEGVDKLQDKSVTITGRVNSVRLMGGVSFIDIKDESGKVQVFVRKGEVSSNPSNNELDFAGLKLVDPGDFAEVTGTVGKTKTGEDSIFATQFRLLTKSLRPMPDEHEGLKNIETRYRQRYIDLRLNPSVKKVIDTRIKLVKEMRKFLEDRNFMEVETPVLQPVYGGASAKPFTTHHHKLDTELFLRISDELYLKRAIVAGYEKVYEIGHDFRNEGIDPTHNPEFTMVEFYWAYADYNDLMVLTEDMLGELTQKVLGTTEIDYNGKRIDFKGPYPRVKFADAIKEHTGVDIDAIDRDGLIDEIKSRKLDIDLSNNPPMKDLLDEFYKATTRPNLVGPLFMIDYPVEMIPLAKASSVDSSKGATMQLVVDGAEIIKAYNELNDPITQLKNFQSEQKVLDAGESEEAQPLDYDFVRALEYGMPPTAGFGLGIDRFVQILTNQSSIKDTILFPTLRPEEFDPEEFENQP